MINQPRVKSECVVGRDVETVTPPVRLRAAYAHLGVCRGHWGATG